jgi:hypothetical protein
MPAAQQPGRGPAILSTDADSRDVQASLDA